MNKFMRFLLCRITMKKVMPLAMSMVTILILVVFFAGSGITEPLFFSPQQDNNLVTKGLPSDPAFDPRDKNALPRNWRQLIINTMTKENENYGGADGTFETAHIVLMTAPEKNALGQWVITVDMRMEKLFSKNNRQQAQVLADKYTNRKVPHLIDEREGFHIVAMCFLFDVIIKDGIVTDAMPHDLPNDVADTALIRSQYGSDGKEKYTIYKK